MQGIYTYIPEINHVPREHCVATILMYLFMVLISLVAVLTPLYLYVKTFRSIGAVPLLYYYLRILVTEFHILSSINLMFDDL
jgi:hypothetical protein